MRSLYLILVLFITSCSSISINKNNYECVIDAGSSGSKIYVYNKTNNDTIYKSSNFIPLASFANKVYSAGDRAIEPLLKNAIAFLHKSVKDAKLRDIKTSVIGTGGMRLIPYNTQQNIYKSVALTIKNNGLRLGETKTITGV